MIDKSHLFINIDEQIDLMLKDEFNINDTEIDLLIDTIANQVYDVLIDTVNKSNTFIDRDKEKMLYEIKLKVFKRMLYIKQKKFEEEKNYLMLYKSAFDNAGIFNTILKVQEKNREYTYSEYIRNHKLIHASRNINTNDIFIGDNVIKVDLLNKLVFIFDDNFNIVKQLIENILQQLYNVHYKDIHIIIDNYLRNIHPSDVFKYRYVDNNLYIYKVCENDIIDKGHIDNVIVSKNNITWDRPGRPGSKVEENMVRFVAAPIANNVGNVNHVIVNAIDVTDLYRYKKIIQLLINEVNVKNFGIILANENDEISDINIKGLVGDVPYTGNLLFDYLEKNFNTELANKILNVKNIIKHKVYTQQKDLVSNVNILIKVDTDINNKKLYDITFTPFFKKLIYQGCSIFISDVTDTVNIKEKSERLNTLERKRIKDIQDFIKWITGILELRDDDTGEHVNRVQYYTHVIALEYFRSFIEKIKKEYQENKNNIVENEDQYIFNELSKEMLRGTTYNIVDFFDVVPQNYNELVYNYVKLLCDTSLFHDMGKVGISDLILNKPARLTEEEFIHIKKHTTIIDDRKLFMKDISNPIIKMSKLIIRHHHEKYDGSGYPDGLSGDQIPLCAHIVSMADIIDALSTKRIYKEAYSFDKVASIIEENSDGHFSPMLIEVFKNKKRAIQFYINKMHSK